MPPATDALPDDLPVPQDDGASRHLAGRTLPPLSFPATDGSQRQLDEVSPGRWVLFLYPLTGEPGVDMPRGWDQIPGARGCSQEACSFRDNRAALQEHGAQQVLALSSDPRSISRTWCAGCTCPTRCCPTPSCPWPGRWTCHCSRRTGGRCTSV